MSADVYRIVANIKIIAIIARIAIIATSYEYDPNYTLDYNLFIIPIRARATWDTSLQASTKLLFDWIDRRKAIQKLFT